METMNGSEQERGILSPEDRAFLRGETEFERESSARNARKRIRDRTRRAFADFGLLFAYMEQRDRRQILDELIERDPVQVELQEEEPTEAPPELTWDIIDPSRIPNPMFTGGMRHAHAFMYLLLFDLMIDELGAGPNQFEHVIEALVSESLQDAFAAKGILIEADVDITLGAYDVDIEAVRERFEDPHEAITDQEVEWLIQLREIEFDDMVEHVRDSRSEDS